MHHHAPPVVGRVDRLGGRHVETALARRMRVAERRLHRVPGGPAGGLVGELVLQEEMGGAAALAHQVAVAEGIGDGPERVDRRRMQPVAAAVEGHAEDGAVGPGADPVGGLQHHEIGPLGVQPLARGEARGAGADDEDVGLAHGRSLSPGRRR